MKNKIKTLCDKAEREISADKIDQIVAYSVLLLEWNEKINVVSRKDTENIFEQHIAPCMSYYLLNLLQEKDKKVIDIGSGGGLPAMINAICYPNIKFYMNDATNKKIMILDDIIKKINLKNAFTIWGRAEEIGFKAAHKNSYDVVTSRGLAAMKMVLNYSLPFLSKEGAILALKGGDMTEEFKEISKISRFDIEEYELDERFHYIERFKTLKIVEVVRKAARD
jgi:16S rRNA (guanine527-N7)-methyltransferase